MFIFSHETVVECFCQGCTCCGKVSYTYFVHKTSFVGFGHIDHSSNDVCLKGQYLQDQSRLSTGHGIDVLV